MAGMENNKQFSFRQIAGLLTAFFFIIAFNSLIIVKSQQKEKNEAMVSKSIVNPFLFMPGEEELSTPVQENPAIDNSQNMASSKGVLLMVQKA